MKTINFYILYGSVVLLAAACNRATRTSDVPVQDTIPVQLIPLNTASGGEAIEATGVFTTEDETALSFKNGGVVSKIYVKEGDPVHRGQLLATVLTSEVDAKADQARLAQEKAQRDYDRAHKLYRDSVATLEQFQNAKTALYIAQQDVKSVQFNQQYSRIYAPSNGYVLAKTANEGQIVGPGTPVLQVNGAADGSWILKVGVSDFQWSRIQVGNVARVSSDALPNDILQAVVFKKSEAIDPNSGTFGIQLKLKGNPSGKLAAGVFGKASIDIPSVEHVAGWYIPYSALLDGNGREGYVFVTEDGTTAKRQKVRVSRIEQDRILIDQGLEKARSLIVSGSAYLLDGSVIRVVDNHQ